MYWEPANYPGGQGLVRPEINALNRPRPAPQPNPLAGMLQMPQFNPQMQINTGIEAGPVWSPQKTQAGVDAIRYAPQALQGSVANEARTMPQAAQGAAAQQLTDATGALNNSAALGFGRQAAQANAKQTLDSQRARAFAGGLPWMNLNISAMQSDLMDRMRRGGTLAQLLAGMVQ